MRIGNEGINDTVIEGLKIMGERWCWGEAVDEVWEMREEEGLKVKWKMM